VDEFQNFATESFETILSEARKYRLNLILGNQFMTQLTDKIREAIIGNVGTVISGRIGITDAEILVKKFTPTFDTEDLTKLPNYQSIVSIMINNVPSAPFSMSFLPPMGQTNPQLRDALKRLSAAKYGKPRAQVEKEIFERLGRAEAEKKAKAEEAQKKQVQRVTSVGNSGGGSSFLDEWLAKRKQLNKTPAPSRAQATTPPQPTPVFTAPSATPVPSSEMPAIAPSTDQNQPAPAAPTQPQQNAQPESLHLRGDKAGASNDSEVSIKLR
ncbi:MAG TPA: TraM recognition domain-containing protein, partial [Candidatus Saccharimonadales bacterium]